MGRTAPLTSKRCILHIYSTNIGTEYFKHALYSPFFFSLRNAVCFIMLTCLVSVLFTFYIRNVLKLKKNNNSGAKGLIKQSPPKHFFVNIRLFFTPPTHSIFYHNTADCVRGLVNTMRFTMHNEVRLHTLAYIFMSTVSE